MGMVCVYPGTFCPPHFGHLEIVKKALFVFDEVYIVCSVNPDKDGKAAFTPEECKEFWKCYPLPAGVRVVTLQELLGEGIDFEKVIMLRGVRDGKDFEYEKKVMMGNYKELGIDKFLVMVSEERFKNISSTLARELAEAGKREQLVQIVAETIAVKMLAKYKKVKAGG